MGRRSFLKGCLLALHGIFFVQFQKMANALSSIRDLNIDLTSAGRIGFYIDYSELTSPGEHTFFVCRTHGTQGAVSVEFTSLGDSHSGSSGTITWADGDASIKSFRVPVLSKGDGEHRLYLELANPTGGAALHFESYSQAYGVIDDDTIAQDSTAVFYDSNAATNGDGTKDSPYNDIYVAIGDTASKRYLYGKGVTVPNSTNSVNPNGGGGFVDCIILPTGRSGELERLIIRNWPGNSWTIDGGSSTNKIGFYSDGGTNFNISNYITFRGINFSNLDASGSKYAEGGGIGYFKNGGIGVNVELCTFENINGSTNTSAFNAYAVNGAKMWRCTVANIKVNGDNLNTNATGVMTYDGKNISVQRCEFTNANSGIYHKRIATVLDTSTAAKFCKFTSIFQGVHYGSSGSSGASHSYTIVQGNLFKACTDYGIQHVTGSSSTDYGEKHWWCNNVFDTCGRGEQAAIHFMRGFYSQIFNNIFLDCRKTWADYQDSSAIKTGVEYADYNHQQGTTLPSQMYEWKGQNYTSSAELFSASGFAGNDTTGDPLFSDYELRLGLSSPCLGTGVAGTDKGIYLTGVEIIGASGVIGILRSKSIEGLTVS